MPQFMMPAEGRRAPGPEDLDIDPSVAAKISAGLGDRRSSARVPVDEPCTAVVGTQIHHAELRDVSEGGAMLRGVPGLTAGDPVDLTMPRLGVRRFAMTVRAVSLLGAHLSLRYPDEDAEGWRDEIAPLASPDRPRGRA
ncbi:PilZ domain-containing protein [Roseomonas sp. PWR1]|uniref:PilZ domain-containing protein n=1 Tax=Roseomonas nitratireducens TaxID=2820810 RepID=A0ABS4AVZ4_9PROT|nr:PilZ domain-containing protein [Neoroseomonas nitratireducens]MBP0464951.1 PilZ domain-containing protein [Neoroseomonas nitratireducens]